LVVEGRAWVGARELAPQRELLLSLLDAVEGDTRFRALEVGCSLGRGNADEFSDVDVGLWIGDEWWDAALDDLEPLLRQLASTVDAAGFDAPWGRWFFAQYADGRQLDLAARRASTAQWRPPDSRVLFDRDGILEARAARKPVDRRAEWAFLAWFELGNVPKYVARGSVWEALGALEQARAEFLRLYAATIGAANPEFGVTSIFDAPGGDVPPRLAETYASPVLDEIREAARVLAGLVTDAWGRPPLAEWVEPQL
jgi:hypothetical protein